MMKKKFWALFTVLISLAAIVTISPQAPAQAFSGRVSPCFSYGDINGDGFITKEDSEMISNYILNYRKPFDVSYYEYDDVLLVANNASEISLDITNYFKQQRNIKDDHIVYLNTTNTEVIKFADFTKNIGDPVKKFIVANNLEDKINYIVTTKGVPLKVLIPNPWTSAFIGYIDRISVDSLLMTYMKSEGANYFDYHAFFQNNPYFAGRVSVDCFKVHDNGDDAVNTIKEPFSSQKFNMYLVTRLTGYNLADVKNIIDKSANAKNEGVFVIDLDLTKPKSKCGRCGGDECWSLEINDGNEWMRYAKPLLESKGYTVILDNTSTFLTNQKNVLGYASWGSNDCCDKNNGKPNNTWANGAIAETLVSTSGRTFNYPPSYGQSMVADLIAEGITGVNGHVAEPGQLSIVHPYLLFDRYTDGYNLADSFYMAAPFINWMYVVVGDPKTELFYRNNYYALYNLTDEQKRRADVNLDGKITREDAAAVLDYAENRSYIFAGCRKRVCGSYGDINDNGYITQDDGLLVANYVSYPGNSQYSLTDLQKERAEVTGDGKVNIGDALAINNYADGNLNAFKVCLTIKKSPCSSYGDINSDEYVTKEDGLLIANYVSYPGNPEYSLSDEQRRRADVTGDGKVNIGDAAAAANYAAGYLYNLKVCKRSSPCGTFGDVNSDGYITDNDSLLVANYVSYPGNPVYNLTEEQKRRADVSNDSKITQDDATMIKSYTSGKLNSFTACRTSPCDAYGDIDDDKRVTSNDGKLVADYASYEGGYGYTLTDEQKRRADVSGNGVVNIGDAMTIRNYASWGRIPTFKICSNY